MAAALWKFWQAKPCFGKENHVFWWKGDGFSEVFHAELVSSIAHGSKEWTWTLFLTFLTRKNTRIFNSNFFQRGEHDLSRKNTTFLEIAACAGTVGSPVQIVESPVWKTWLNPSLRCARLADFFSRKYFNFYFYVRNVKNNVHAHSFDPWASPGSASFGKPLIIDIFLYKSMVSLPNHGFLCQNFAK